MTGRHRHRRSPYSGTTRMKIRKREGWGMNLYRNTRKGRIAGVAAGLADHWDVAHWVVRLLWVGAFLFTGTLAFWAYLAAWILLAPQPSQWSRGDHFVDEGEAMEGEAAVEMEYDERKHDYRPRKVFRYSASSTERLQRARERLDDALQRVEHMEQYVTSRQYQLNKEFAKL